MREIVSEIMCGIFMKAFLNVYFSRLDLSAADITLEYYSNIDRLKSNGFHFKKSHKKADKISLVFDTLIHSLQMHFGNESLRV